jgi:hypothetical protein
VERGYYGDGRKSRGRVKFSYVFSLKGPYNYNKTKRQEKWKKEENYVIEEALKRDVERIMNSRHNYKDENCLVH